MKTTKKILKGPAVPDADLEALHRAYVREPITDGQAADVSSRATLLRLAKKFDIDPGDARSWAILGEWHLERQANDAQAWAAKQHRGAPLDLEGFAAYCADKFKAHLERPVALAWGRELWYRRLVVIAHWEAARVVAAGRMTNQRMYAKRDARPEAGAGSPEGCVSSGVVLQAVECLGAPAC